MRSRLAVVVAGTAALALGAAGCGGGSGGQAGSKTIKVAYEKFGTFVQMDQHMQKVKAEFEKANPVARFSSSRSKRLRTTTTRS